MNIWLEIFLKAIVTTIGAFVPIFILMFTHFLIRKSFYKKAKPLYQNTVDFYKKSKTRAEDKLDKIYKKFNVSNLPEIINKLILDFDINKEVLNLVSDLENQKSKDEFNILVEQNHLDHLESYSFKDYLVGLLNKNFADPHFEETKK